MECLASWHSTIQSSLASQKNRGKSRGRSHIHPLLYFVAIFLAYCSISREAPTLAHPLTALRDSQGTVGLIKSGQGKLTCGENKIPAWKLKNIHQKEGYPHPYERHPVYEKQGRHISDHLTSKNRNPEIQSDKKGDKSDTVLAFVHSSTIKQFAAALKEEKKKVISCMKTYLRKHSSHTLDEITSIMISKLPPPNYSDTMAEFLELQEAQSTITKGQYFEAQAEEFQMEEKLFKKMKLFLDWVEFDQMKNIDSYIKIVKCDKERKQKLNDDFQFILSEIKMDQKCWEFLVEKIKFLASMEAYFQKYKELFWRNLQRESTNMKP